MTVFVFLVQRKHVFLCLFQTYGTVAQREAAARQAAERKWRALGDRLYVRLKAESYLGGEVTAVCVCSVWVPCVALPSVVG